MQSHGVFFNSGSSAGRVPQRDNAIDLAPRKQQEAGQLRRGNRAAHAYAVKWSATAIGRGAPEAGRRSEWICNSAPDNWLASVYFTTLHNVLGEQILVN
jgi:hypothetical protein